MSEEKSEYVNVGLGDGFTALMRELKLSLYTIARTSELGNEQALVRIQAAAEQNMRLIDSYILSAQSEYGQLNLDLSPMAIGSVMHEAAHTLRANLNPREVVIHARALQPVMTHREVLHNLLSATGQAMADVCGESKHQLIFRSYETRGGDVGVGVFARDIDITPDDLKTALALSGSARMPLARHSTRSGVMLVIADGLARALGGSLEVKRMGKLRGLATTLPRSEQLVLV